MRKCIYISLVVCLFSTLLSACGQTGKLYLPTDSQHVTHA